MKDLILITAYCPDSTRLNLLSNLVDSIDNTNFDILISSHSIIPDNIQKKVNFCFYDKENPLVQDIKSSPIYWQKHPIKGKIYHSKLENSNTFLAVFRLVRYGLSLAKILGYKIVHHLEYDSLILDDSLLYKNSKLIQNKDCLFYNTIISDISVYGSYKCLNLDLVNPEYLDYNETKIRNHFKFSNKTLVEGYVYDILTKNQNYIKHDQQILFKNIKTGLYLSDKQNNYIVIPYIHENQLIIFTQNFSQENLINIKLNINYNLIKEITCDPHKWYIIPFGDYDKINYIECIVNNKTYFNLDLNEDDNRLQLKSRHYWEC